MPPRWSSLALAALIATASCSAQSDGGPDRERPVRLDGRILATGFSGGDNVQVYDLATGRAVPVSLPSGVEVLSAFWGPGGDTAYALTVPVGSLGTPTEVRRARLYEAVPGRDARPVGRPLTDTRESLSVAGSVVLASECRPEGRHLVMLDLDGERRWERVAPGCTGALSPDGTKIVYARGTRIFERSAEGGRVDPVGDVATVVEEGRVVETEGIFGLRYARGAIVALVVISDRVHPAIGGRGEPFELVRMQDYPSFVGVAPQPGGDLVGLTQLFGNSRTSALIWMHDFSSGRSEVVGAGGGGYFEPAWAPDGSTMVVSNYTGNWVFIDSSGDWIDVRKVTGLLARDWAP